MKAALFSVIILWWVSYFNPQAFGQSEVFKKTNEKVVVREHPKTGEPYVSLVSMNAPFRKDLIFSREEHPFRPDYRMLDPDVRSGDYEYEGPYSSRKKVYVFAATIATAGSVGALAGAAAFPAAAGASAAGGSGLGLGAGAAVAGTAATTAVIATRDRQSEDYIRRSETHLLEDAQTDFYRLHMEPVQKPMETKE